ncbi:MAG: MarR family transcriptional regulator [Pseudoclavibacter sp.]
MRTETPAPDERTELVDALARTAFEVTAVLSAVGAAHGLSLTQMRTLGILRDRTLRASELARYLGLERSTLSGLIDRASARGLLRRRPDPDDRRAVRLELSDQGRELAEQGRREVAARLDAATPRLGDAQRRRLAVLLETFLGPVPATEKIPERE